MIGATRGCIPGADSHLTLQAFVLFLFYYETLVLIPLLPLSSLILLFGAVQLYKWVPDTVVLGEKQSLERWNICLQERHTRMYLHSYLAVNQ